MASIIKTVETVAPVGVAWSAVRDIGALHTRLVPGFVTNTVVEDDARVVTFANGSVVREPIISIDDEHRRLVWSAETEVHDHYNGAAQVIGQPDGTTVVVWTADFKPDALADYMDEMMTAGAEAMKAALDAAAEDAHRTAPA